MVHITKTNQGGFIGISAIRILRSPAYGQLSQDPEQAEVTVRTMFSRFLMDLHSSAEPNNIVAEILFLNQGSRVVPYVILRQRGAEAAQVNRSLTQLQNALLASLADVGFQTQCLVSEQEFTGFAGELGKTDCRSVLAVSKKEIRCAEMFYNGGIYCADVIRAPGESRIKQLTKVLSQYSNSAISLQLIPTRYDQAERDALHQAKRKLGYAASSSSGRQLEGGERMSRALELYSLLERGPLFYNNFLVYSSPEGSRELAKALMDCMENADPADSALETVDLSTCGLRPDKRLASAPWAVSNLLVYEHRKQEIWGGDYAPSAMIRLKYLMSGGEALGVFRLPVAEDAVPEEPTVSVWSVPAGSLSERTEHPEMTMQPERTEHPEMTAQPEKTEFAGQMEKMAGEKNAISQPEQVQKIQLMLGTAPEAGPVRLALDTMADGLLAAGTGADTFARGLLRQGWKVRGVPFLVLEPSGTTYRTLVEDIPELRVFTPCRDKVRPFAYNPFRLPKGVTVRAHAQGVVEVFAAIYAMSSLQEDVFARAVLESYRRYGWKPESTREDETGASFGLQEFILVFRKYARSQEYGDLCRGLLSRLKRLVGQDGAVFDTAYGIELEDLLETPAVIELEQISCKIHKLLLMQLLMQALKEASSENHLLLLGNAHWLSWMPEPAKGTGRILTVPDGCLTRELAVRTGNQLFFRLVEQESIQAAAQAAQVHESLLGQLEEGQALFCGTAVGKTTPLRTVGFAEHVEITDENVACRDQAGERPFRECGFCGQCSGGCDTRLRERAGFGAEQLLDDYLEELEEERDLLRFLVQMDGVLEKLGFADQKGQNCCKLQFLRRAILEGNYRFSPEEYRIILEHPCFLKPEGGSPHE